MKKLLLLSFVIGFFARLLALDQSLWLDEAATAKVVRDIPFDKIVSTFSRYDFHPPLYYFVMKVWSLIFGTSEIALRLPSVIFSLLTAYIIVKTGRLVKNELVGSWAAIFFLFNPLIIYYSQEARMYMMAIFFLTSALYFFIKITSRYSIKDLVFVNIFIALSLSTFYGSIFLIVSWYLWCVYQRKIDLLLKTLPGVALTTILLSPIFYLQFSNSRTILSVIPQWSQSLGAVNFKNLALIPIKFSVGKISFSPKIVYYAVSGFFALFTFGLTFKGGIKNRKLLFLFLSPILLGLLFSYISPLMQYFRFIYLLPIMCLLLALGSGANWQKYLIIVGFTVFSFTYLLFPQFHREDWKRLSSFLPKNKDIYIVSSFTDPLNYYDKSLEIKSLADLSSVSQSFIVIPYGAEILGIKYKIQLEQAGYRQVKIITVRGLQVEYWENFN